MTNNTPAVKDWFILGFATGSLASLAKTAINYALLRTGAPTSRYSLLASSFLLGKRARFGGLLPPARPSRSALALGYLTDALLGGLFGSAMAYAWTKTPPGNELLKGAIGGSGLWLASMAVGKHLRLDGIRQAKPPAMVTLLGTNLFFGGLQGVIFGRIGQDLVSQSRPVLVNQVTDQEFARRRQVR